MTEQPTSDDGSERDRPDQPLQSSYEYADDESPSEAVVRAVASLTNTDPLDLDPLYDVVDPEHLDGTFEGKGDGPVSAELTFVFGDCRVTVTREEVRVRRTNGE